MAFSKRWTVPSFKAEFCLSAGRHFYNCANLFCPTGFYLPFFFVYTAVHAQLSVQILDWCSARAKVTPVHMGRSFVIRVWPIRDPKTSNLEEKTLNYFRAQTLTAPFFRPFFRQIWLDPSSIWSSGCLLTPATIRSAKNRQTDGGPISYLSGGPDETGLFPFNCPIEESGTVSTAEQTWTRHPPTQWGSAERSPLSKRILLHGGAHVKGALELIPFLVNSHEVGNLKPISSPNCEVAPSIQPK